MGKWVKMEVYSIFSPTGKKLIGYGYFQNGLMLEFKPTPKQPSNKT